jgi:hypothetical protein
VLLIGTIDGISILKVSANEKLYSRTFCRKILLWFKEKIFPTDEMLSFSAWHVEVKKILFIDKIYTYLFLSTCR